MSSDHSGDGRVIAELTARVEQLEKNQRTAEDRLKVAIFDQIPFTIWASTRDFKIVLWNPYCERNYGFARKEALDRDYVDLFVDDMEADDSRKDCLDVIENDKQFRNFLAYDHAKDGTTKTMLTNCFRVYDEERKAFLQVEVGVVANELNLDLAHERLHSLREYAQRRKAEHVELLQFSRTELLKSIADTFQRQRLPIGSQKTEIHRLRMELKGDRSAGPAMHRLAQREEEIDAEFKRLQEIERDLLGKATDAKTLSDLKMIRDKLGS